MRFDWDPEKARTNVRKHGVSFQVATAVFADPFHMTRQDRVENFEVRWQTLGMVDGIRIVVVAHTLRDEEDEEVIRIISARPATREEQRQYDWNRIGRR